MLIAETPTYTLFQGSCLEELKALPDASVQAIATDPPYGFDPLDENGQEKAMDWDLADGRRNMQDLAAMGDDPARRLQQRMANGVNYQMDDARHDATSWGVDPVVGGYAEAKGLVNLPRYMMPPKALLNYQLWCAMWAAECYRVLVPGGHMVAFNGSKTHHRMGVGIEDAGFEIRDTISWIYGKGQPHGTRPWQAMDRAAGFKREKWTREEELANKRPGYDPANNKPQSEDGQAWEGWYTGLKPAHELIYVARKPFSGPIHKNILEFGTGAYNVDACAVPGDDADRFPANIILTHAPDCGGTCVEWCPVAILESQQPGASQFFTVTRWEEGDFDAFRYVSKPSNLERHGAKRPVERNPHPTVKPVAVMEWLITLVTPPGGTVADPFAGSGTTGRAAIRRGFKPILVERDPEFIPFLQKRLANTQLPLLPL